MNDKKNDSWLKREMDYNNNQITNVYIRNNMQNIIDNVYLYQTTFNKVLKAVNKYRDLCLKNINFRMYFYRSALNLVGLYKLRRNWLEAAKLSEEMFHMNKDDCLRLALPVVVDSYDMYNLAMRREDAVRVYKEGATMFFKNCEPFYKYVFSKDLKNIKGVNSALKASNG
jgi:hypothetical protein